MRQVDRLLRIDLATGETTEVATEMVPVRFDFTQPGGDWITFQTQDGHAMLDARVGEVVSRVEPPANRAYVPEPIERAPSLVDADGDTVIVALERQRLGPNATQSTVWLVSPDYPDGLEIEGPAPDLTANFILSPDGATLYTTASERQSGPEDLWMTPLGKQQVWETVAEDVTVRTFVPLASEE